MSLVIEEYSTANKEAIISLILQIQQKEFDIPIDRAGQPDLDDIPNFYQKGMGNFWVALIDEKVAGTIALVDIGNKQGALRKMFVKEEYRGKELGVASALLQKLLSWSKDRGAIEVFLGTTAKFLAAQRFYEKNGFLEIDKSELPSSFPVMAVDVKFYVYHMSK